MGDPNTIVEPEEVEVARGKLPPGFGASMGRFSFDGGVPTAVMAVAVENGWLTPQTISAKPMTIGLAWLGLGWVVKTLRNLIQKQRVAKKAAV